MTDKIKKDNKTYGASDIVHFENPLDHIRHRPGMYIGGNDAKGSHHLIWEVFDNSTDEVLAHFANHIKFTIGSDKSITVEDNGRGLPVGFKEGSKESAILISLTKVGAGGKFNKGKDSAYNMSAGLNGVGLKAVTALSKLLEVTVKKDGHLYYISLFNGGKYISDVVEVNKESIGIAKEDIVKYSNDLSKLEHAKYRLAKLESLLNDKYINLSENGTTVRFITDTTVMEECEWDREVIKNKLKTTSYLIPKLTVEFEDIINDTKVDKITYYSEEGIADFIKDATAKTSDRTLTKIVSDKNISHITDKKEEIKVDFALQYVNNDTQNIITFVNNINTNQGGTHLEGLEDALKASLKQETLNTMLSKKEQIKESVTKEDIYYGLYAVVSIKHHNPSFKSQTKDMLSNLDARKAVREVITEKLSQYLLENPDVYRDIAKKIAQSQEARLAAKRAREKVKSTNDLGLGGLSGKLSDCSSKNPLERELFLVEGDSAGGSAKLGRDRRTQAILALKGKVLNTQNELASKISSNQELLNIITSIGTNFGENFDITKLRYNKVFIFTDADSDGSHIRLLLLTFFKKYMPQLITDGHLYVALSPLYKIMWSKNNIEYALNDEEKARILKEGETKYAGVTPEVGRYKGLGEMDPEELWETTMDPNKRTLKQITIEDADKANIIFENLMGKDSQPKKELIFASKIG